MNHPSITKLVPRVDAPVDLEENIKAVRQFRNRKNRIKKKRLGRQNSWLLLALSSLAKELHRDDWIKDELLNIRDKLPKSAYRHLVDSIIQQDSLAKHFSEKGHFSFSVQEGLQIIALPNLGIFAFRAPPGNLKKSLEFYGISCEWNWGLSGRFHRDKTELAGNNEDIEQGRQKLSEDLAKLHSIYGRGEGATLAIVDCGISTRSKESKGRVIWQGLIQLDEEGYTFKKAPDDFEPQDSHGNQVACIAAGSTVGFAPGADIISFVLPLDEKLEFEQLSLFFIIESILEDNGTILDGPRLRNKIDTILIPAGVVFDKKIAQNMRNSVRTALVSLHDDNDICIISAIGNVAGQVTFPSDFPFVHAVGSLTWDGKRHHNSGYDNDCMGSELPNSHFLGENIYAECVDDRWEYSTGTSFASAAVGGLFTLLAPKYRKSAARMTKISQCTVVSKDEVGTLRVLDIRKLD